MSAHVAKVAKREHVPRTARLKAADALVVVYDYLQFLVPFFPMAVVANSTPARAATVQIAKSDGLCSTHRPAAQRQHLRRHLLVSDKALCLPLKASPSRGGGTAGDSAPAD